MTMNGQHESDLPFSGNRRHRVPLLLRRSRGRIRLHRGDDASSDSSTATIRPTALVLNILVAHHRVFSILAGRSFLMEIILAVRAPFRSGCLLRRLSPVTSSNFENHYRTRAAFLRRPIVFSSRRSPGGRSPPLPAALAVGSGHRVSLRSDRHRRRNFSHTSFTLFPIGRKQKRHRRSFCVIYSGKFNCWSGRFC